MKREHGGGLDSAVAAFGGTRSDWLDLSTGINPVPYPLGQISDGAWTALPDRAAMGALLDAARAFWSVPDGATIVAAPGASALIARMPVLTGQRGGVHIPGPSYSEHAAAVALADGFWLTDDPDAAFMHVYVHPNNPDGRLWDADRIGARPLTVIDESFCDVCPAESHVARSAEPGIVVLKSFGKFWGLAGLRLGFAIGAPATLAPAQTPPRAAMTDLLGPWAVSGPALEIGARALSDPGWAETTRTRLADDAGRLDDMITARGAELVGGTTLFRLYDVDDAAVWQTRLARHHVWSRIFPYNPRWLRLGLPAPQQWDHLERALG